MSDEFSRSRLLSQWFYTLAFVRELGPIAAAIFVVCGLIWLAMVFGWWVSCGLTLFWAPWCH